MFTVRLLELVNLNFFVLFELFLKLGIFYNPRRLHKKEQYFFTDPIISVCEAGKTVCR